MPTHRRPVAAPTGRRRVTPLWRVPRLLPVVLGLTVLGVAGVVGPTVVENVTESRSPGISLAALPADKPAEGLVYEGLQPAQEGSVCAGAYQLAEQVCTHGPDSAPTGLEVRRGIGPVTGRAAEPVPPSRESSGVPSDAALARDQGGSALTADAPALVPDAAPGEASFVMGPHDVACVGDGRNGKRIQVLYLHEFGSPSRYTDFVGSFRVWSAGADQIFDASAAQTGGSRHLRFVTTPQCRVEVAEVQLPTGGLASFAATVQALQTLGYNRTDRKYLAFSDATVYCGISTYIADTRAGAGNRNNGGPSYGRVDSGCWGTTMAAHELTRTLGAVLTDSPNSSGGGGCLDDYDLLCGPDRSGKKVRTVCPKVNENRLDCGNDDYFSTNPKPGSYLAKHWNLAFSDFLLRGDGGDEAPETTAEAPADAVPSPEATPSPTTTVVPESIPVDPAPATSGVATVPARNAKAAPEPAVVEVRDPTSSSVRLNWSAASPTATYEISVGNAPVATTKATRARLIGLKPDAKYQVTVRSGAKYTAKATAETAPAGRPAQNTWFTLTNAMTGGAADLYAARTADGTPLTLSEADGTAQQQWKLVPATGGAYSLVSRATGKCAVPLTGNPVAGTPLVQGDCQAGGGLWSLQESEFGITLRTTVGDLVAGVGNQRFGAHRVLVLQDGNGQRHQSWSTIPE